MSGRCVKELRNSKEMQQYQQHRRGCRQRLSAHLQVLFPLLYLSFSAGCNTLGKVLAPTPTVGEKVTELATSAGEATSQLAVRSWVGGISTLVGIAALVITRGTMGMRAILIGVCLVILNFAIANYLSWILIPVLVATGTISLAWAYVTVKEILNKE